MLLGGGQILSQLLDSHRVAGDPPKVALTGARSPLPGQAGLSLGLCSPSNSPPSRRLPQTQLKHTCSCSPLDGPSPEASRPSCGIFSPALTWLLFCSVIIIQDLGAFLSIIVCSLPVSVPGIWQGWAPPGVPIGLPHSMAAPGGQGIGSSAPVSHSGLTGPPRSQGDTGPIFPEKESGGQVLKRPQHPMLDWLLGLSGVLPATCLPLPLIWAPEVPDQCRDHRPRISATQCGTQESRVLLAGTPGRRTVCATHPQARPPVPCAGCTLAKEHTGGGHRGAPG